jgi:DNA-directed RNA polymerase specialized sigma24 family protein
MPSSTSCPPSAAGCDASSSAPRTTRILVDLHHAGMRSDEVEILYAHHVLGYSIAELAAMTGRDRRSLYARRDRGQRRLSA